MTNSDKRLEEATRPEQEGFCVARRFSDQTLAAGGGTGLQYDVSLINDNGCFNMLTGQYTCPKAGRMFLGIIVSVDTFTSAGSADILVSIEAVPSFLKGNNSILDRVALAAGNYALLKGNLLTNVSVGTVVRSVGFSYGNLSKTNASLFGGDSILFFGYYLT